MSDFVALLVFLLAGCTVLVLTLKVPVSAALVVFRRTSAKRLRANGLLVMSSTARLRAIGRALYLREPLNYETVIVTIRGQPISIDHRLAGAIDRLNRAGIETTYCCQGCHTPGEMEQSGAVGLHGKESYVMFAPSVVFPPDLISAVIQSGLAWTIGHQTLTTLAGYVHREELFAINATFVELLEDWAAGAVDGSGVKYCARYALQLQTVRGEELARASSRLSKRLCSIPKVIGLRLKVRREFTNHNRLACVAIAIYDCLFN